MRLIGFSVVFGLPGLLVGFALGLAIRRWAVLAAVVVVGGDRRPIRNATLGNGPSDNDPGVIWAIALVANFIGVLVGAAAMRLVKGPSPPHP
jgi:uncharacterized iron-regulated membrane protein